jgi:DUF4097 and DUF4098 domain-containing protein YvlB
MTKQVFKTVAAIAALCVLSTVAWAQKDERGLNCDNHRWNSDQANHCVMREFTLAPSGIINVDGRTNGGVSVKGWDRADIYVRAQVQTWAKTDDEAKALSEQVQIETAGGNIRSEGPTTQGRDRRGWAVSFEVFVPRRSDLMLKAHNGGISVREVRGNIQFDTTNGGVNLAQVAGNVKGTTTNGGVNVTLDGNRWDGDGLDVRTTNGGVKVLMPANYAAHLETGTVNGGLTFDFPVTVQGKIDRELSTDIGGGGPPIRVRTTNGGVSIRRQ